MRGRKLLNDTPITQPESAIKPDSPIAQAETAVTDLVSATKGPSLGGVEQVISDVETVADNPGTKAFITQVPTLVKESKAGYKTTEFWSTVGAAFADLGLDLSSKEKILISALAAAYAIARGFAKNGTPNEVPLPPEA